MTSNRTALILLLAFFTPLAACDSLQGKLTRSKAEEIIKSTSNFNSKLVLRLETNEGLTSDCNGAITRKPLWRALYEMGWIQVSLRQISPGSAFSIAIFSCDMSLTDQGQREANQWEKFRKPWGLEWEIPIATRQLIAVTGMTGGEREGSLVQADFTWRWVFNETGNKLRVTDPQTHSSRALFRRYDDGWRIAEAGVPSGNSFWEYIYQTPLSITSTPAQPSEYIQSAANSDICRFCGDWEYYDRESQSKSYLKITRAGAGLFRLIPGYEYKGQIVWQEGENSGLMISNADGIYLKSVNGTLIGTFVSANFRATHGQEFTYTITCDLKSGDKMIYSVQWYPGSSVVTESYETTKKS